MAPTNIIVQGLAVINRIPERGVLEIEITDEGYNKDSVSTNVITTAHHLQSEIDKLAPRLDNGETSPEAPVAYYSIASLTTSSHAELDDDDNRTGKKLHQARTSLEVRFRHFPKLGEVAVLLSTMQYVNLKGVTWKLTEESQRRINDEAKMDALRDALKRARAYTEIIGRETLKTVKIEDSGHFSAHGRTMQTARRISGTINNPVANFGLDFEPKTVVTTAYLNVEFEAE